MKTHQHASSGHDHDHNQRHDHHDHDHHAHDHGQGGHAGHDHGAMIDDFKRRFWISLVLSIPIVLLSPMIQSLLGYELRFAGDQYVVFGLSSIVFFYGGWPFLTGMVAEIKNKAPGMMTLIGMAIIVAYAYSSGTVFGLPGDGFFWELATLIVIMLLGHWIEMKSVMGASKALQLLVEMMPSEAHRMEDGEVVDVALDAIRKGDIVMVKPGEKVPVDGVVVEGESHLNESMLTGESMPVKKSVDSKVMGGSINGNQVIKVEVEHTGEDTYLTKVISMVREAQKTKSKMQNLSDRAAKWLTYVALGAGLLTLTVWLLLGHEFVYALERMVTVMVISCPHALGVAIPLVVAISTSVAASNGLLIRNRTAFEQSRKISAVVFDKTGTLTEGNFAVTRFEAVNHSPGKEEVLGIAASLERNSEHPIATGIVDKASELGISIPDNQDFAAITGQGIEASIDGKQVKVVSPGYLREQQIAVPDSAQGTADETVVFVLIDQKVAGYIALSDAIRAESFDAIATLRKKDIKVFMATGDNEKVARAVADQLGLDGVYAEVLPHEKVDLIKALQAQGEFVAMTGDGVNDAPALAQADIGIAVGSGTDVAAETADIILVRSNPRDITNMIIFGTATYRKMIQNLAWATGYNALAIPLAAGVLAPVGFILSPAVGAVLMSLSTVIVAVNAQLLRKQIG